MRSLLILTLSLAALLSPAATTTMEKRKVRKRPLLTRKGKFITTHLDLIGAASSLLPSFLPLLPIKEQAEEQTVGEQPERADKLIADKELEEPDSVREISENLDALQSFGAKLKDDLVIHEAPAQLQDVTEYTAFKPALPSVRPVNLVYICADPKNCPPPQPSYGYGAPYGAYPPPPPPPPEQPLLRPYGVRRGTTTTTASPQSPEFDLRGPNEAPSPPAEPVPVYTPASDVITTRRPTIKKYGFTFLDTTRTQQPTIFRQQVLRVRKPSQQAGELSLAAEPVSPGSGEETPAPALAPEVPSTDTQIGEEDINSMSIEELREFISRGVTSTPPPKQIESAQNGEPTVPVPTPFEVQGQGEKLLLPEDILDNTISQEGAGGQSAGSGQQGDEATVATFKEEDPLSANLLEKDLLLIQAGLSPQEADFIEGGVSTEELIALKNDMGLVEMVAMKHNLDMTEVIEMKEQMTAEQIRTEHPDIPLDELVGLKADLSIEEMVAMKNGITLAQVAQLEAEVEMEDIMSLKDGLTQQEVVAILEEQVPLAEVIELKQMAAQDVELEGLRFPSTSASPTTTAPTTTTAAVPTSTPSLLEVMMQRLREKEKEEEATVQRFPDTTRMKMRPLRMKVRRPNRPVTPPAEPVEDGEDSEEDESDDVDIEQAVDEAFGLKKVPKEVADAGKTQNKLSLILEPTPAVPGKPVFPDRAPQPPAVPPPPSTPAPDRTRVRNRFNQFLETTVQPLLPLENIVTVDLQKDMGGDDDEDYPIYDTKVAGGRSTTITPTTSTTTPAPPRVSSLASSQNNEASSDAGSTTMPVFQNFPMLRPGDFVQVESSRPPADVDSGLIRPASFRPEPPPRPAPPATEAPPSPPPQQQPEAPAQPSQPSSDLTDYDDYLGDYSERPDMAQFDSQKPPKVQPPPPQFRPEQPSSPFRPDLPQFRPEPPTTTAPQQSEEEEDDDDELENILPAVTEASQQGDLFSFPQNLEGFANSFMKFAPDRPESIDLQSFGHSPNLAASVDDEIDNLIGLFNDENHIAPEPRPERRPAPRPRPFVDLGSSPYHPNHNYPRPGPTNLPATPPFTARSQVTVVPKTYVKNNYRPSSLENLGFYDDSVPGKDSYRPFRATGAPLGYNGFDQSDNTPLFRNIQEDVIRSRLKPPSTADIKPFVNLGEEYKVTKDYNDQTLVGLNFYNQYGQHDDRPTIRRQVQNILTPSTAPTSPPQPDVSNFWRDEVKETKFKRPVRRPPPEARPSNSNKPSGSIKSLKESFGPADEEDDRPVSAVYPNHPVSSVFPNKPVSEVFVDLPENPSPPSFPSSFSGSSGISIVDTEPDIQIPSFKNFFKDAADKFLDNPFGDDFIKLEIDQEKFNTNKSAPSVHHIPLDIHGFPKVPNYEPKLKEKSSSSERPISSSSSGGKKKKLYRPPPVLTKYEPPLYRNQQEKGDDLLDDVDQKPGHGIFPFMDAMGGLPSALHKLPIIMEKLMGNHASWVERAWKGDRDESARSLDSLDVTMVNEAMDETMKKWMDGTMDEQTDRNMDEQTYETR